MTDDENRWNQAFEEAQEGLAHLVNGLHYMNAPTEVQLSLDRVDRYLTNEAEYE